MRPIQPALVVSLLLAVAALAHPAAAGDSATPEITDPPNDFTTGGAIPTGTTTVEGQIDLIKGWISEDATNLTLTLETNANIAVGVGAVPAGTNLAFDFTFSVNGTSYAPGATVASGSTAVAVAPATAATISGKDLILTVPKSAVGAASIGSILGSLTAHGHARVATASAFDDTATSTAVFTTAMGVPPTTTGGSDSDSDGLNDTWETTYYNSTTAVNGTSDTDGDGCNSLCEQSHGTNPNKADTDGDGATDGQEIAAGTDPLSAASKPTTTTTTTTTTTSSTTSSSTTTTTSSTTGSTSSAAVADRFLKVDTQYLAIAGGGAVLVIILAMIGRFGRWGL